MICNKCGKNNSANAEICSVCKEPLPKTTNCGGFADILTYTAPAPTSAPVMATAPVYAPAPVAMEPHFDEPWYKELLSKKNIISLAAIGACVITVIIVLIAILTSGGGNNNDEKGKELTADNNSAISNSDYNKIIAEKMTIYTIGSKAGNFPKYKYPDGEDKVQIKIVDANNNPVIVHLLTDIPNDKNLTYQKGNFSCELPKKHADFVLGIYTAESSFPLKVYYNESATPEKFQLVLKDGNLVWEEIQKGNNSIQEGITENNTTSDDNNELSAPRETVSGEEVKVYAKNPTEGQNKLNDFPKDASQAKLHVPTGNSKDLVNDPNRVYIFDYNGNSIDTNKIFDKQAYEEINVIFVYSFPGKENFDDKGWSPYPNFEEYKGN